MNENLLIFLKPRVHLVKNDCEQPRQLIGKIPSKGFPSFDRDADVIDLQLISNIWDFQVPVG